MNHRSWAPIFLFPLMLAACHGNSKKDNQKAVVPTGTKDSLTVEKAVDLPFLSTETYVSGIISRRLAIENALPGKTPESAVLLYRSFALYVDTALLGITANESKWLDEYVNYGYSKEKQQVMPPANVAKRIELLATAGIEPWSIGEGYTELRTQPGFYTHLFKNSLPADYKAFLQLQADEDTVLYNADAGLMISFNEVGKRTLNWEKFLDTYPNSIFAPTAKELYERYCRDYLFGEDNTMSFDDRMDLNSLVPENKKEYLSFIQLHGNTKTAALVKQFLDLLNTEKTYDELQVHMQAAIAGVYSGLVSLLPPQPEFRAEQVEALTKAVYDTVPAEVEISQGNNESMERALDSLLYFQQDNNLYCVAIFTNRGKSGGAPVSGWVDVWAFKKTGDHWQTVDHLLNAGGGGMYGNSGYFDKLIRMGSRTTGIVISGGITHMGSNVSWDDLIALTNDKLTPVMNIVTNNMYEGGNGVQKCNLNKWMLQHNGEQENDDLVIVPSSCIGSNVPLDRVTVPYKNGRYNVPAAFQDKGI
ncbi:hypothetical protein SAMN04488122_4523 [Chitinophaga arvensicola]|uniref:Uncharacterized protein n=2 Tax=Chitinophaga arvensicola TaxID=29529 RepID=A0A1I0S817_9BACT|nr:hypothetical protein SAMN04488122_4523 [Chitinophaga arvensicola]